MRELSDQEVRLLQRAQRRRRAADAMAVQQAALRGAADLAEDVLSVLPVTGGRHVAALRVRLLQQQIASVQGAQALPLIQTLLERACHKALGELDLGHTP
jgi:hypothetical protein